MTKQLHPYKSGEDTPTSKVKEASLTYVYTNVRNSYLDIISDFDKGLVISYNQIDELVKARMGWKCQ